MIVEVLCDIKSSKSCPNDSDVLQVKMVTCDLLYAGTDSQVRLLLRSSNGFICQVLDLDNSEFNDDNGLNMVALAHLTKGNFVPFVNDAWFIEVRKNEKFLFDYRFHTWTSLSSAFMFGLSKINNKNYTRF
ncbi:unnamed protein product [Rotaria sordida]|uniref:PLAT domain-containing protein n=1 Tax=Rotaria sordida TaxID=392033 RepID=A0A815HTG4_9BILA|nr:unnamed protein product [Rotaria sordida]CAF1605347.1 unnamed protein product [Rotaria sordida]